MNASAKAKDLHLPIHAPRLLIRPIHADDEPENYQAMMESTIDLQRWMSWSHPLPSEQRLAEWVEKESADFENRKPQGRFSAYLNNSQQLAVSLGVTVLRRDIRRFHVSYWVRTSLAGQGYATEALIALSQWLFDVWNANRIDSGCAKDNIGSRRVLEKAGYSFEGVQKNATHLPPDGITDELIYAATDRQQLSSFNSNISVHHA
ncbi:MAG: GNAT family N-acetyltransferase [Alphaproteobacteria bacterium]